VQCGYGRTGRFFAIEKAGIQADIYTMAKGMGNGFPVGGILIAPHIKAKHGMLGTTFGGNHLACAAALGVLEVMEEEQLMEQAKATGEYLMHALRHMEGISNVRGLGLMIGFDMPAGHPDLRKHLLSKHHIFTGEAKPSVIRLLPALNITKEQADEFLEALATEINAMKPVSA
jgi:acetylornithine aminotransferase